MIYGLNLELSHIIVVAILQVPSFSGCQAFSEGVQGGLLRSGSRTPVWRAYMLHAWLVDLLVAEPRQVAQVTAKVNRVPAAFRLST